MQSFDNEVQARQWETAINEAVCQGSSLLTFVGC